jgi:hypothetical protein
MYRLRRLKRIRPIASRGRGVTGSTLDFSSVRCVFDSHRADSEQKHGTKVLAAASPALNR